MTLLEQIASGKMPDPVKQVADEEGVDRATLRELVARGQIVIPGNVRSGARPAGVGRQLRTKVNANIGTSPYRPCLEAELAKLDTCLEAGADAVIDLSVGGDLRRLRGALRERCPVMMGGVPIYALAARLAAQSRPPADMTEDELFATIEQECCSGLDFITVHCGTTTRSLAALRSQPRTLGIVSRGGSLLAAWMTAHGRENPLYASFDRLLEIAHEHDVTLSLGDALRPGSVVDAGDRGQIAELIVLGELGRRARAAASAAIIEGPGHVPLDQIAAHVQLQKQLCDDAPFFVLGPLTTDIAAGHDHIAAAIGGALAAAAGADFLCYVTPAEHLRLPDLEEVRAGVIAARIAAHSGDIARGLPSALERDRAMSAARAALNWETMFAHCLDPVTARGKREASEAGADAVCTMCGVLCAVRTYNEWVAADGAHTPRGAEAR